jgi:hypothetical protein
MFFHKKRYLTKIFILISIFKINSFIRYVDVNDDVFISNFNQKDESFLTVDTNGCVKIWLLVNRLGKRICRKFQIFAQVTSSLS